MPTHRFFLANAIRVEALAFLIAGMCVAQAGDGYYAGRCTDGRSLAFALTGRGNNVSMRLELEGVGCESLDFKTNAVQRLEFAGFDSEEDDSRQPLVRLWLTTTNSPSQASGCLFLKSHTNALPFTAQRVADQGSLSRKRGLHVFGRGGGKTFKATWPEFQDSLPFHRSISKLLATEARTEASEFNAGASELIWEGLKTGEASCSWEGSIDTDIVWLGTNLVSLLQLYYGYTGGAHGNSAAIGRNFILVNGKAREFTLQDLFLPVSNWENVLSAACLRELRRQHASWVMPEAEADVRVKGFKAEDMVAFNVDRFGLIIHFNPYAVGPYAEGMFQVVIPWSELEDLLAPNGPANQLR